MYIEPFSARKLQHNNNRQSVTPTILNTSLPSAALACIAASTPPVDQSPTNTSTSSLLSVDQLPTNVSTSSPSPISRTG